MSSIPSDATVESATLHIYQAFSAGAPISDLGGSEGALSVFLVDYGTSLDELDYNTPASAAETPYVTVEYR